MIADIIARLKAQCPLFAARVEGPTNTGALERTAYPLAIVYPLCGVPGESFSTADTVRREYSVEITATADNLEAALSACIAAMNRFQPTGCLTPFAYTGDKTTKIEGELLQITVSFMATMCL